MRYSLWLWGFPFLLSAEITWQAEVQEPFALKIQLSSEEIFLTDSLHVDVACRYPSSYQLDGEKLIDQFISFINPLFPSFSMTDFVISLPPAVGGMQTQRLEIEIAPLVAARLELSLFIVTFFPKEEAAPPFQIETPLFSIKVLPSPLPSTLPFAPLIPLDPPFPLELTEANDQRFIHNAERLKKQKMVIRDYLEKHSFPWLTAMLILGCGGVSWVAYLTREKGLKPFLKHTTPLSPKEQLDQALEALRHASLIQEEEVEGFYEELRSLVLGTLQVFLGWKSKEMTTAEVEQALRQSSQLSELEKQIILSFLTTVDQVRFGGKKGSEMEAKQFYQSLESLILTQSSRPMNK